jgi:hypothetical protein
LPDSPSMRLLSRREFTRRSFWTAAGTLGWALNPFAHPAQRAHAAPLPRPTIDLLDDSPFVYVSPLKSNGMESTCHGELWFGWLDDAVVATVAADGWKATALARGLSRARIWVGDHGRWKGWLGSRNEAFRAAPRFDARGERVQDPDLLDRLLDLYERKYPDEIDRWREPMRAGNADGTRVLLRYVPL